MRASSMPAVACPHPSRRFDPSVPWSSIRRVILPACLSLAAACGGPSVSVPPAPAPEPDAALAYKFTLEREPDVAVRVTVSATGSDSSSTVFAVEREWGGVTAGGDDLSDPRAVGADGRTLGVERPEP